MAELGTEPSFRAYLHVLRRRKWWLASITLLGLAASLALSLTAHKQYSATAQLLVQPSVTAASAGTVPPPVTQTDVATELQLVTSAPVVQAVRGTLGSAPAVSAAQVTQTNVIAITATSPIPSRAARIANLYAKAFVQYRERVASSSLASAETQLRSEISALAKQASSFSGNPTSAAASALLNQEAVLKEQLAQMQVSGAANTGEVALVTPAQLPVAPSSPKPVQDALLGLAAGFALGLGASFLRESLDDRLASKDAAERAGGAPVLAMTPLVPSGRRPEPVVMVLAEPSSPGAEAYRSLRTSLQFARQERRLRVILVTSPAVGDGKTSTLANLGVVFARAGERVLLVSGDLRRPKIGEFFGIDERVGLTSILLGEHTLEQALVPVPDVDRLTLLPAGPIPPNPAEVLNGDQVRATFGRLREQFDLVLIDSPPVLPVTDAAILSRYADATLMLAAAGQTRRADLHRAAEKLDQVGATILGIVLNKVTRQTSREYGYGYGYGDTYGYGRHTYRPFRRREAAGADAEHLNGNSKLRAASHTDPA
jgi:succinoglycan biosynthesis transport protein ExoP